MKFLEHLEEGTQFLAELTDDVTHIFSDSQLSEGFGRIDLARLRG